MSSSMLSLSFELWFATIDPLFYWSTMQKARITGIGSYLPERVLTNADLEKMVETSDEWIVSRTGMKERRIARADEFTSHMALAAGRKALESSGIKIEDVDAIIVATMTADCPCPGAAVLVQAELGAVKAAAFDLGAACSGYIYALSVAKAYVESGMYRNVLVIAAEKMSAVIDYTDRNTCVLFGDGASASVVSAEGAGFAIEGICLGADGTGYQVAWVPGGGTRYPATEKTIADRLHFFKMEGKELFKHAVRRMEQSCRECLTKCGLETDQISWLIPHQANTRIIDAMVKRFEGTPTKVYNVVHRYGNTSAASVAIAFNDLMNEEQFKVGEHFLLVVFGAGLTWGSAILTKIEG